MNPSPTTKVTAFDINNSISLLSDDFYIDIVEKPDYRILTSRFTDQFFNFIIPKVKPEKLNWVGIKLNTQKWIEKGYDYSYYIKDELTNSFSSYITSTSLKFSYSDLYIYKKISTKYQVQDEEIVKVDENNLDEFIDLANICFPESIVNEEFTTWCMESPNVELLGIKRDNKIVTFGAYFHKRESDYVLLMNDGTLLEYRRLGLHNTMIKLRINEILDRKKKAIFYANVEPEGGSDFSYKKLGFKDGPIYHVYI